MKEAITSLLKNFSRKNLAQFVKDYQTQGVHALILEVINEDRDPEIIDALQLWHPLAVQAVLSKEKNSIRLAISERWITKTSSMAVIAAILGFKDIVATILEADKTQAEEVLKYAARNGHLDIIKYCAIYNLIPLEYIKSYAVIAAESGHPKVIKYCFEELKLDPKEIDAVATRAAFIGDLDMVKYCFENYGKYIDNSQEIANATEEEEIEDYIKSWQQTKIEEIVKKYEPDEVAIKAAIKQCGLAALLKGAIEAGNIALVDYLNHQYEREINLTPTDQKVSSINVLAKTKQNHAAYISAILGLLPAEGDGPFTEDNASTAMRYAESHNNLYTFKNLAKKFPTKFSATVCAQRALKNKHNEIVEFCIEKGASPLTIAKDAATLGNLEILRHCFMLLQPNNTNITWIRNNAKDDGVRRCIDAWQNYKNFKTAFKVTPVIGIIVSGAAAIFSSKIAIALAVTTAIVEIGVGIRKTHEYNAFEGKLGVRYS